MPLLPLLAAWVNAYLCVLQPTGSCARSFYVRVLGFQRQPRPPFPFGGAWLTGGGLTLHLIDDDPTIPHALGDWRVRRAAICARVVITLVVQGHLMLRCNSLHVDTCACHCAQGCLCCSNLPEAAVGGGVTCATAHLLSGCMLGVQRRTLCRYLQAARIALS